MEAVGTEKTFNVASLEWLVAGRLLAFLQTNIDIEVLMDDDWHLIQKQAASLVNEAIECVRQGHYEVTPHGHLEIRQGAKYGD